MAATHAARRAHRRYRSSSTSSAARCCVGRRTSRRRSALWPSSAQAGMRPVVVVSAFEGVTDTILASASVLLPDGGAALREPGHEASSAFARETDRALATGEALSAALFALGLAGARHPGALVQRRGGGHPDRGRSPGSGGASRAPPAASRGVGRGPGAGGGRLPGDRDAWRADDARAAVEPTSRRWCWRLPCERCAASCSRMSGA